MFGYDKTYFDRRADMTAIYPGNTLWMVTAGEIRRVEILSALTLDKGPANSPVSPDRWMYSFKHCSDNTIGGITSHWSSAEDYGLGKKSSCGNALFYNEEDARLYCGKGKCPECGRERHEL